MQVTGALKSTVYYALKALTGSKLRENLAWLRKHEKQPFRTLQALQDELLVRLCREAQAGVPAYRERFAQAGISESSRGSYPAMLARLPLTARYDIVNDCPSFIHRAATEGKFHYVKTGGSTGTPALIGQNSDYRAWSDASTLLFNSWVGLSLGTPYLFLWGAAEDLIPQRTRLAKRMNLSFLQGRQILDATQVSASRLRDFIDIINRRSDCDHLIGYANEIFNLASYSLENGVPLTRKLKGVFTTAENLTSTMRDTIEQVFGCKVLNKYGCRDVGDIACECPYQSGLHVNPLFCRVDVADDAGNPLPYGSEGQLVLTSLHNRVMPLIRYAVGDMGIMKPAERCECGREWETIVRLTGRTSENVLLPGGAYARAALLHGAFENLPQLKRYQIHQLAHDHLLIKLRSSAVDYVPNYAAELEVVARKLRLWTGFPLRIEFEQTNVFHRTPTGKELMVVQRRLDQPHYTPNPGNGPRS
jgi:phenylacetate-CoA ligase